MTEQQRYIHLRLRQARRAERPYILLKAIFIGGIVVVLLGLLQNCGSDHTRPTKEDAHKTAQTLWAGDAQAHNRRIP